MNELTLKACVESIEQATEFVDEKLMAAGCPPRVRAMMDVALDEWLSNVAHYAYPPGEGEVTVRVTAGENHAEICFADNGVPYDPLAAQTPDTTAKLQDRPIGGLGIFLIRKTMDEVTYAYRDGKNIFTIAKAW